MHRIDTSTATGDGRFTEGDPLVPTPATVVSADWLNSVQEELVNTLSAAGIAPDKTNNAQLLAAIRHLVGTINTPYEALRKNLIGVPRYWRSTTLPANHVWANGDFVLFSDWPELKKCTMAVGSTECCLRTMPTTPPSPPTSVNGDQMPLTLRDYTFLN